MNACLERFGKVSLVKKRCENGAADRIRTDDQRVNSFSPVGPFPTSPLLHQLSFRPFVMYGGSFSGAEYGRALGSILRFR